MKTDVAIIGAGPAGVSAAINLRMRGAQVLLFGEGMSEKVRRSELIDNYPGIPGVNGKELAERFADHLKKLDIAVTEDMITAVYDMGGVFYLLGKQEQYEAKCVIIASGVQTVRQAEGEARLLGSGVSYCATCDGALYKGKTIAVLCDSPELEHEVTYLADIAEKVYYLPVFRDSQVSGENIQRLSSGIKSINGEKRVESITLAKGDEIKVDGVFMLKKSLPPDALLTGIEIKDGHIAVDRGMRTNITGCFAAGDCTGRPYQLAKAVGEGNIAAHSALDRLAKSENM